MGKFVLHILFFFLAVAAVAQSDDPVLFSVEGKEVRQSEFEYIYNKNNAKNADYSRSSLEEYLELYIKFKLKVQRARDMQLDTIPGLMKELAGYRQQLANSYLNDKEVVHRLVEELYTRMQRDIELSHILIGMKKNAGNEDTLEAYNKANTFMDFLHSGTRFEPFAQKNSDDKRSAGKGGYLGYLRAMLPNGFYALENQIYSLKPGEIGGPIRTPLGYHIVKVHGSRESRGEMEAAHLLVRKKAERCG